MPKDLFFTIAEEKQHNIIQAALKEFSQSQYNDASINQIIKHAQISRGSFYQYFTDKEDLYFYLINQILTSTTHQFLKDKLNTRPIDVFKINRELFLYNLSILTDDQYGSFFRNLYLSLNFDFKEKLKFCFDRIKQEILFDGQDKSIQNLGYDQATFRELTNILELINRDLLALKITKCLEDEKILEIYDLRIGILRKGVY